MEEDSKLAAAAGAVTVALLVASIAIAAIPGGWTFLCARLSDVISAASALGTISAAAAAVYFGLAGSREKQRTDLIRAVVLASRITPRLEAAMFRTEKLLHPSVESAVAGLFEQGWTEESDQDARHREIRACVTSPAFDLAGETIEGLAPLKDRVATRLAQAVGIMRTVKDEVTDGDSAWCLPINDARAKSRAADLRRWRAKLEVAQRHLVYVHRRCELAVQVHAPAPTGNELPDD